VLSASSLNTRDWHRRFRRFSRYESSPLVLCKRVIRVAIEPTFPRFGGGNDRMSARMSMFGRVAVGRGITTKCDATLLASSQVHPWRSGLHAQLADPNLGLFDLVDSFDMSTHFNQHQKLLQPHRPYPSLHFEAAPAHLRGASETRHTPPKSSA